MAIGKSTYQGSQQISFAKCKIVTPSTFWEQMTEMTLKTAILNIEMMKIVVSAVFCPLA